MEPEGSGVVEKSGGGGDSFTHQYARAHEGRRPETSCVPIAWSPGHLTGEVSPRSGLGQLDIEPSAGMSWSIVFYRDERLRITFDLPDGLYPHPETHERF